MTIKVRGRPKVLPFFFFSSRRRHTRLTCDWSSDVCSSDLVPQCPGVDHMDFTADGRAALVSCEFSGRMIVVDLVHERVLKTLGLRPGAMPQDVKLSPDGKRF